MPRDFDYEKWLQGLKAQRLIEDFKVIDAKRGDFHIKPCAAPLVVDFDYGQIEALRIILSNGGIK